MECERLGDLDNHWHNEAALYKTSGNTSLSLSQPPSNVKNGLGIFTGVASDRLFLTG